MLDNLKKLLKEYNNLKEEKKDIQNSLSRIQKQLERLEEKGYKVKDSVKGGEGGIQIFKVEGYPYPEYIRVKTKRCQGAKELYCYTVSLFLCHYFDTSRES